MRVQHWVFLTAVLLIGYAVGVKYPAWGHQLGL